MSCTFFIARSFELPAYVKFRTTIGAICENVFSTTCNVQADGNSPALPAEEHAKKKLSRLENWTLGLRLTRLPRLESVAMISEEVSHDYERQVVRFDGGSMNADRVQLLPFGFGGTQGLPETGLPEQAESTFWTLKLFQFSCASGRVLLACLTSCRLSTAQKMAFVVETWRATPMLVTLTSIRRLHTCRQGLELCDHMSASGPPPSCL